MNKTFLSDNFLLETPLAQRLYHEYAKGMPICDFHNHLSAADIASDRNFENISDIWLKADHYKWRAMRIAGISEACITGAASDWDKFKSWARTISDAIGNPLYVWTHLELQRYFDIQEPLSADSAKSIYERANALLKTTPFSPRNLLKRMNVAMLCTTDDPTDELQHHAAIRESGFEIRVLPTFRPDRLLRTSDPQAYTRYLDKLAACAQVHINTYSSLIESLKKRCDYFHAQGCRIADHSLEPVVCESVSVASVNAIFYKLRQGLALSLREGQQFQTAIMVDLARLYQDKRWTMQLHMGALRNTSSRVLSAIGADAGCDTMDDAVYARPLGRLLDLMDSDDGLPQTLLYNLNGRDNEMLMSMAGCFAGDGIAAKVSVGPAWWFADQRDGMQRHLASLASLSLLGRFIGMTTDSRSLLSFPRHEYFRRILCKFIGELATAGEVPDDAAFLGSMIKRICFDNAQSYFHLSKDVPNDC